MMPLLDRGARTIAVTSGKGGVGKTVLSVNLAVALAEMGRQAMLLDADIGLSNANIMLGLHAAFLAGECSAPEVVRHGPSGVFVMPEGAGHLARDMDHVVIDTATGLAPRTMELASTADAVLLMLTDEPTAFMGAYRQAKALAEDHGCGEIAVVTNLVADERAGARLFHHFEDVASRYLDVGLSHMGSIPRDDTIREAIFRKRCCLEAFPRSRASDAFRRIAAALVDRSVPVAPPRPFEMEALHGAH